MQTPYTYGPVMLTSLERVAFYLNKDVGLGRVNGRNDDTEAQRRERRAILAWILDISSQLQNHCRREFLIQSRVQYFDNLHEIQEFWPSAVPILQITKIEFDPLGLWPEDDAGVSEVPATEYTIGPTGGTFRMMYGPGYCGANTLKYTGLGGLAYHGTQSVMTLEDVTDTDGDIVAGRYAYGSMTESIGKVIAFDADSGEITLDSISGSFIAGEGLAFQPAIYSQDIADVSATIATIDRQSLVEAHPNIARALDIEIRFMQQHEKDYENQSDGGEKSGATRRPKQGKDDAPPGLQLETQARLADYVRYLQGS